MEASKVGGMSGQKSAKMMYVSPLRWFFQCLLIVFCRVLARFMKSLDSQVGAG